MSLGIAMGVQAMIWVWIGGLVATAGLVGVAWGWLRRRLLVVTVRGNSMSPTYRDGDRVLVCRARGERARAGQVVVVDLPRRVEYLPPPPSDLAMPVVVTAAPTAAAGGSPKLLGSRVVKRVAAAAGDLTPTGISGGSVVPAGKLALLGDNRSASSDSRHYGYVPTDAVVGIAIRPLRCPEAAR